MPSRRRNRLFAPEVPKIRAKATRVTNYHGKLSVVTIVDPNRRTAAQGRVLPVIAHAGLCAHAFGLVCKGDVELGKHGRLRARVEDIGARGQDRPDILRLVHEFKPGVAGNDGRIVFAREVAPDTGDEERLKRGALPSLIARADAQPKTTADVRLIVNGDAVAIDVEVIDVRPCLLYTSPSPRDRS